MFACLHCVQRTFEARHAMLARFHRQEGEREEGRKEEGWRTWLWQECQAVTETVMEAVEAVTLCLYSRVHHVVKQAGMIHVVVMLCSGFNARRH